MRFNRYDNCSESLAGAVWRDFRLTAANPYDAVRPLLCAESDMPS
mgnify:CR=1 FL=1